MTDLRPKGITTTRIDKTPPSYKPVVSFSADELVTMRTNIVKWLKDPPAFKLWLVVRGLVHIQVKNKLASDVAAGRSGPSATLRAQSEFAEVALQMSELIEKLKITDITEAQVNEALVAALKETQEGTE